MSEFNNQDLKPLVLNRHRAIIAVTTALAFANFMPGKTEAQASPESEQAIGGCLLDRMKGPDTTCDPIQVPPTCVTPESLADLRSFKYVPEERQTGIRVVNKIEESGGLASPRPTNHLEIGAQDESGVVQNANNRQDGVLLMNRQMGAKIWRLVFYPYRTTRADRMRYDKAVKSAVDCGYDVQASLALNDMNWTTQRATKYMKNTVSRYKHQIHRWEIGNEVNWKGDAWLKAMPGKTAPETYRHIYDLGYRIIKSKRNDPTGNNEVYFGNFTSNYWPMKFFKAVLDAKPGAVKADALSIHPYRFEGNATEVPELHDPTKNADSKVLSYDGLHVVNQVVDEAHAEGKFVTPEGKRPPTNLGEFNEERKPKNPDAGDALSEVQRTELYVKLLAQLCLDPRIAQIIFYQFDHAPVSKGGRAGLVGRDDRVLSSFYGISEWQRRNPECLKD